MVGTAPRFSSNLDTIPALYWAWFSTQSAEKWAVQTRRLGLTLAGGADENTKFTHCWRKAVSLGRMWSDTLVALQPATAHLLIVRVRQKERKGREKRREKDRERGVGS